MISMSGGLKLRAVAGRPSVTRLTHSSWTGISASGIPKAAVRNMLYETHTKKVMVDINVYYILLLQRLTKPQGLLQ